MIREHFERHKTAYQLGSLIAVAGITCYIMRGRHAGVALSIPGEPATVFMRPLFLFSNRNNIVVVVAREGRGHPGYIVRCIETGDLFLSQAEAAESAGTIPLTMSRHLRGLRPHIHNLHYERIAA